MKRIVCEMCGSTDIMKEDGVYVCQSCGTKYSVEEARRMLVEISGTVDVSGSTVKLDNTGLIDSYLQMAENALNSSNNAEAENYANKIIEIDPKAFRAWFIKGKAAGWQTTGLNNRYPESVVNWINAYQFASDNKKEALADEIKSEAMSLSVAILQMELNSFTNYRSKDNKNDIDNALSMIEKQLGELKDKTGIEVYTDAFKTILSRAVNGGAIDASNAADKDFGPENINRDKYNWDRFIAAQDWCLSLLDKAYNLSSDDDLCLSICKNYIMIAEQCRDSCSYKFQASAYSDGIYVRDYSFTQEAKNNRSKIIKEWKAKQAKHDPATRKSNCKKAQELVAAFRGDAEKQMAIVQYWQEHSIEKINLEREKTELEERVLRLQSEISANADKAEMDRINTQISNLENQITSLGFFKGKEKKALQAEIDNLEAQKKGFESRWNIAKEQNDDAQSQAKSRIHEIDSEFTKDRGTAKIAPRRCITLFNNGEFVPTAMQLVEYNRAVLPKGITVKNDGKDAIENYSRSLMNKAQSMLALLSALSGNSKAINDLDFSYEDDPEQKKAYRINFAVNGKDSNVSLNFMGKTINSIIEGEYYYTLEEEKTPQKVANFVRIVSASILGICPNIDLNVLQKAITEVAFGINSEQTFETDGILITVKGSSKSNSKVELKAKYNKT